LAQEIFSFQAESVPDSSVADVSEALAFGSSSELGPGGEAESFDMLAFLGESLADSADAEEIETHHLGTIQDVGAFGQYNSAAVIPFAPPNLVAVGGDLNIDLTWDAAPGATSYNIYRSLVMGGPYTLIASGNTDLDYTDGALTNGVTYYYIVKGATIDGEGASSNEADAIPVPDVPGAPINLVAAGQILNIALAWDPPTLVVPGYGFFYGTDYGGGSPNPPDSYSMYRSTVMGGPYFILASGLAGPTHDDPSAIPGTPYYYVVRAVNGGGEGPNSNEATATALPNPEEPPPIEFEVIVMWDPINQTLSIFADISAWPGKSVVEMTAFAGTTDITPLLTNVGDPKVLFIQAIDHPIKIDVGPGFPVVTTGKVYMINLEQGVPPFLRISAAVETDILVICAGNP
jgi:hypothetical protein